MTVRMFLVLVVCVSMTAARPPQARPSSSFSLVWCYWAGQAAFSGDGCQFGQMMGPCGPVCLRGPGDLRGGAEDSYGVCGTGMMCQYNVCIR